MNKNKVHLTICGIECVVGSDDPESYVLSVGDEVQKAMNEKRQDLHNYGRSDCRPEFL